MNAVSTDHPSRLKALLIVVGPFLAQTNAFDTLGSFALTVSPVHKHGLAVLNKPVFSTFLRVRALLFYS